MNINIRGELYDLSSSKVMGILNLTPDSFYDGGKYNNVDDISNQISKMVDDGLDILDIGGYSSRPGAKNISSDEEKSRVVPVLKLIKKKFPQLVISIDTFRSEIEEKFILNFQRKTLKKSGIYQEEKEIIGCWRD